MFKSVHSAMAGLIKFDEINGFKVDIHPHERKYMCCVCESFILIPPVYLNPSMGFICGFCWQHRENFIEDDDILLPQKLYEEFALSIRFPCSYCGFFTHFNEPAATHEIQCTERIFGCPLSKVNKWFLPMVEECEWQDNDGISMVAHIKEKHKEFILQSPLEISLRDLKCKGRSRHLYIAILTNRKIVSITVEYEEEKNGIAFRCRSNKTGYPKLNYQCRMEVKSPHSNEVKMFKIRVFPLASRIVEKPDDYCTVGVDMLHDNSIFRLAFEPSSLEPDQLDYYYLENDHSYDYY